MTTADGETPRMMRQPGACSRVPERSRLDHITRTLTLALRTSGAAIVSLDDGRQRVLSSQGSVAVPLPRELFSAVPTKSGLLVVAEPATDARWRPEAPAQHAKMPGFYVHFWLKGAADKPVGVLCAMNDTPLRFEAEAQALLCELGGWAQGEFDAMGRERACIESLRARLVAPAMHKMRGALTSIQGFSEFLLTQAPPEAQRQELLGIIHEQSHCLSGIVDELTDLVRLEGGTQPLQYASVSLGRLLHDRVGACGAPHRFKLDIAESIPALGGEEALLVAAFDRLLKAALALSAPPALIGVAMRCAPDGEQVEIRVEWESTRPVDLAALFQPFSSSAEDDQAIPAPNLALTRGIVESHGGRMQAEHDAERGIRITTQLPLSLIL